MKESEAVWWSEMVTPLFCNKQFTKQLDMLRVLGATIIEVIWLPLVTWTSYHWTDYKINISRTLVFIIIFYHYNIIGVTTLRDILGSYTGQRYSSRCMPGLSTRSCCSWCRAPSCWLQSKSTSIKQDSHDVIKATAVRCVLAGGGTWSYHAKDLWLMSIKPKLKCQESVQVESTLQLLIYLSDN